jgi:hypothetical protein
MNKILFLVLAPLMLVGCSYDLALVGRDTGVKGSGVASGLGSGDITVNLNGRTYKGDWVSSMGTGSALVSAEDGSRLHCEFKADIISGGYGTCEDEKKKIYDVQIH